MTQIIAAAVAWMDEAGVWLRFIWVGVSQGRAFTATGSLMQNSRAPSRVSKVILPVLILGGIATVCWIGLLMWAAEKALHILFG